MSPLATPTAVCLLLLPLALPATAQDAACHDRIAAMMQGGALDAFQRPPHRFSNTVTDPDGAVRYVFDTLWDTPARSVSGIKDSGNYTLVIDSDSWTGPSLTGPWTKAPNQLPPDREAFQRKQMAQMVANLTDTACPGTVDLDGMTYETVTYFTKTDPDDSMGGAWFGALNTVYIDPDTDQVMRWEMTDFVSSFAPEVSKDRHTQLFTYDPSISLKRPD
ncbi:hypothetical protein ANTHELSMS3_00157 [Antarctobacter heliothermus]|uniref:Lipoprotein n=1 Tax=Antarctobacter heliothermus TaxID=74033 RepID=A0A222DY90_9RHOB|nr:hypothetical protein [Antarctobacter heliothermus]ASP18883.1 hypothetical protein ANTHELSMS3_00157 [Antarctobacter heliothermus]